MSNAYAMEFRREVVQVARNPELVLTLEQIAADFWIHPITLSSWLKRADIYEGTGLWVARVESGQLRQANKHTHRPLGFQ